MTHYHWADFINGAEARELGYAAAKAALPDLLELLRWRQSLAYRAREQAKRLLHMY